MRRTSRDDFESRKRWIHREMAVGIDFHTSRMVDGEQADLIEIIKFLLGLDEAKSQLAVFQLDVGTIDLEIFRGIRDISLAGADPVADDSRADNVCDKLKCVAIPRKQKRT